MLIFNIGAHVRRLGIVPREEPAEMTTSESKKPPPFLTREALAHISPGGLYYGLLVASAVLLILWQAPALQGELYVLALLIAFNIAAGLMPISIYGESHLSVGFVVTLTIIVLFGVPGAVILGPLAAFGPAIGNRKVGTNTVINAALFTLVDAAAAASYQLIGERDPQEITLAMGAGLLLATVVTFVLNAILLGVLIHLTRSQPVKTFWERHSWIAPHYAAMGVVGFVLASAYISIGVTRVIAFVTPAFMMRLVMKQCVDKTTVNVNKLKDQNAALLTANIEISRVSDELRTSYDGTLEALVNALDARDQETKGHSIRVSKYMMDIAQEMGVVEGSTEWTDMQRGSLLHDVGKIGVSDTILLKPAKLTDDEWMSMRQHPQIGYNMLHQVEFLRGPAEIILAHHERWDGNGYPRGLRAEEIPFGARIFATVDTFDSMTSDRPYRSALPTIDAMNEILRFNGQQFDPLVVEAFLDIYDKWVEERDKLNETMLKAA